MLLGGEKVMFWLLVVLVVFVVRVSRVFVVVDGGFNGGCNGGFNGGF